MGHNNPMRRALPPLVPRTFNGRYSVKTWQAVLIASVLIAGAILARSFDVQDARAQGSMSPDEAECLLENLSTVGSDNAATLIKIACAHLHRS